VPPIHREVVVDADPATAFDVFTTRLGRWWPVTGHSVHGAGGTVAFAGGQIIELSAEGERTVWGTVTPLGATGRAGLHLVPGWEVFADPAAARANYGHGWPQVLGAYQEHINQPADGADTWVAS
jgi:hypothetical protein